MWQACREHLGPEARAKLEEDFPALPAVANADPRQDYSLANAAFSKASGEARRLAEKKNQQERKVTNLRQQLQEAEAGLQATLAELAQAEARLQEAQRNWCEKAMAPTQVAQPTASDTPLDPPPEGASQEQGEDTEMGEEERKVLEQLQEAVSPDKKHLLDHWQEVTSKRFRRQQRRSSPYPEGNAERVVELANATGKALAAASATQLPG